MLKKSLLLISFILLFPSTSFAAEFLIQAKPHWKDAWSQSQVNSLSAKQKRKYDARSTIGDIIVVKPNGWAWGREEALPNYYILKVPNLSVADAEYLVRAVTDAQGDLIKKRRYQIPQPIVNQLNANNGVYTINVTDDMINNLIDKLQ